MLRSPQISFLCPRISFSSVKKNRVIDFVELKFRVQKKVLCKHLFAEDSKIVKKND
jgi:hypothetical protein